MTNVFIKEHCRMKRSIFRRIRGQKAPRSESGSAETFGQGERRIIECLAPSTVPRKTKHQRLQNDLTPTCRHHGTYHLPGLCQCTGPLQNIDRAEYLVNMKHFMCITSDGDDFIQHG